MSDESKAPKQTEIDATKWHFRLECLRIASTEGKVGIIPLAKNYAHFVFGDERGGGE